MGLTDGEQTLYVEGDQLKPWTAYCADEQTYLSLLSADGANFSSYKGTPDNDESEVITVYSKVRIDPATFVVDTNDQTFAMSTGSLMHDDTEVTSMPFAVAMNCSDSSEGTANINLTGTPFKVVTGQFAQNGSNATGSATYSAQDQVVELAATGLCGWESVGNPESPFNMNGPSLALAFIESVEP